LQNSTKTFSHKMKSFLNYFINSEEKSRYQKISTDFIDMPQRSVFIWKTFMDFQNPLLKKYKFDEVDFCVGATESFKHFFSTITNPEVAEYMKSNNSASKPDCVLVLEEISSPQFFEVCSTALKTILKKELPITFTDISIRKVSIMNMQTLIYKENGEAHHRDVMIFKKTPSLARLLTNVLIYPKMDQSMDDIQSFLPFSIPGVQFEVHKVTLDPGDDAEAAKAKFLREQKKKDSELIQRVENNDLGQIRYNDNSVVAVIDVLCDCVSTYKEAGSEVVQSRNILPRLTFSGCISGHTELEWRLISFGDLTSMIQNYRKQEEGQQSSSADSSKGSE